MPWSVRVRTVRSVVFVCGGGRQVTRSMHPSSSAVGTYTGPSAETDSHSVTGFRARGDVGIAVLLRCHCQLQADSSVNCTVARATRG